MLLECDAGNTRCKWRVLDNTGARIDSGVFSWSSTLGTASPAVDDIRQDLAQLPQNAAITRLRMVCVKGPLVQQCWSAWSMDTWGVRAEFAAATPVCAGVSNGYMQPAQLGVDRWLAILAAYHQQQSAVLVIVAGTALTVDVVRDDGHHLGGYIVPGRQLMYSMLQQGAYGVKECGVTVAPNEPSNDLSFGRSTVEAVDSGVWAAMLGTIQQAQAQAAAFPEPFVTVLTGGAAQSLQALMPQKVCVMPDLVLDGLRWALP